MDYFRTLKWKELYVIVDLAVKTSLPKFAIAAKIAQSIKLIVSLIQGHKQSSVSRTLVSLPDFISPNVFILLVFSASLIHIVTS